MAEWSLCLKYVFRYRGKLVRKFKYDNGQPIDIMGAPIEVSNRAKSRLEALQAEIREATGREISQREVIERVVERQYNSKADLVNSFRDNGKSHSEKVGEISSDDDWTPPSDEEITAFFSGTTDWGFETSEEEIDDILYGK